MAKLKFHLIAPIYSKAFTHFYHKLLPPVAGTGKEKRFFVSTPAHLTRKYFNLEEFLDTGSLCGSHLGYQRGPKKASNTTTSTAPKNMGTALWVAMTNFMV